MKKNSGLRVGLPYAAAIAGLHATGIFLYLSASHHGHLLGWIGLIAYTLGLRHAFDVDHIAAIDNSIRKLMYQRRNPSGVGFFFSLGHSMVVLIMVLITYAFYHWARIHLPHMKEIGSMVGMLVSGGFLFFIGILNLLILRGIHKVYLQMKKEQFNEEALEGLLMSRGFLSRFISPLFRLIQKSWHMFPLGFLFGLGFDTASEISILAFSIEAAKNTVPLTGILSLPLLFASGMCLLDTADGLFMQTAYKWAFSNPLRKIYYNFILTVISVMVAFLIGGVEWGQVVLRQFHFKGSFWSWIENLSFHWLGYTLVGIFIVIWIFAFIFWKVFRMDERSGSKSIN